LNNEKYFSKMNIMSLWTQRRHKIHVEIKDAETSIHAVV